MWSRKRFDIGWIDLLDGILGCLACWDRQRAQAAVEQVWSGERRGVSPTCDALACLSVRTGWDLLLSAADFPPGSEVLMSAVTIPDMAQIIEHHGLTPVPLDLDPQTMLPTPEQIEAAVTPKTKTVLIAHLFGTSSSLEEHIECAHRHRLLFVEDCAQAFRGRGWTGHAAADVSMFSFGTIKTASALGGGMLSMRDPALLAKMRTLQAAYPVQSRWSYLQRIVKYMGLKSLSYRTTFRLLIALLKAAGKDFDKVLNNSIRGFPAEELIAQLRQQPCAPLLRMIHRRLARFDEARQLRASQRGQKLLARLSSNWTCPGASGDPHVFWVFPLLAASPEAVLALLRDQDFDATQGQSLVAIDAPADREELTPTAAQGVVERLLFLPFYDALPDEELDRMADVLKDNVPGDRDALDKSLLASSGAR